jgi:hypothetical protein
VNYPDWSDKNDYENGFGTYNNLAFALIGPPDENDLAVKSIVAPKSGELTASTEITIAIENAGIQTQTGYQVTYQVSSTVDGELTLLQSATETVTEPIAFGEVINYTFAQTADLSEIKTYSLKASVNLGTDTNNSNNSVSAEVTNFGELFIMGTDKEVTACQGIFTDNGSLIDTYNELSNDTITFYPGEPGNRIALNFTEFNIGGDIDVFDIFDGSSVDAPLLFHYIRYSNDYPTYIQARNATGAITVVVHLDYAWDYPGWAAEVSCIEPYVVDFKTLALSVGEPATYILKGQGVPVNVKVTNAGSDTTSRLVYLLENEVKVDSISTAVLNPGQIDPLVFTWIPSVINNQVNVKIVIENDPQDSNNDNTIETVVSVFAEGSLLESFEGSEMPFEWISKTGASSVMENSYYATHGNNSFKISGNDTVIMPLVLPVEGDTLKIDAAVDYSSDLQLLFATNLNGPWEVVGSASYLGYSINTFAFDLSDYKAEPCYFALTNKDADTYTSAFIDNVRGPKHFYYTKDLMAVSLIASEYAKTGVESVFKAIVFNLGTSSVAAGNCQLKLRSTDSVYTTVTNKSKISSKQQMEFEIPYVFESQDTTSVYVEILFAGEDRTDNNLTNAIEVKVLDAYVHGGETTGSTSSVIQLYRTSSIAEMVYYPAEVGLYGNLKGIELTYNNLYDGQIDSIPLTCYIATSVDSFLVDTAVSIYTPVWKGSGDLQFKKVFQGTVNFYDGENKPMYLPFDEAFEYNGASNLVLVIVKDSSATQWVYPTINTCTSTKPRFLYGYQSNSSISLAHLNELTNGSVDNYAVPNIKFHFDNPGAPVFITVPSVDTLNQMEFFEYNIEVAYSGSNNYQMKTEGLPVWLTLNQVSDTTYSLKGFANTSGTFSIVLNFTDGIYAAKQRFDLTVKAVPQFFSMPDTITLVNEQYVYTAIVFSGEKTIVSIAGDNGNPDWITVTDNTNNTATVSGTPGATGNYSISIIATHPNGNSSTQTFVLHVDNKPMFAVHDNVIIPENQLYQDTLDIIYQGLFNLEVIAGSNFPEWLSVSMGGTDFAMVSGTALLGQYNVEVIALDGFYSDTLNYSITVGAVPAFTSEPVITATVGEEYSYNITTEYNGTGLTISSDNLPAWLTLTDNGDGTASLVGTPTDAGSFDITLTANGEYFSAEQQFTISAEVGVNNHENASFTVYPNPATNLITISALTQSTVTIMDISGKIVLIKQMNSDKESIDVTGFEKGMYFIKTNTICLPIIIE